MNLAKHERNMTVEPVRVLHILEATGGGTMRYMENIAEATLGLNFLCGFAYGISRADSSLLPFLDRVKRRGWQTFMIEMGREIKEANLTRYDLFVADELFATGTGAEVVPISEVDGRKIGPGRVGPITEEFIRHFKAKTQNTGVSIY